ncbi:2,3-diaminopropionate biosynthesis protein SbnB [Motiliproteus sp. MSK22-1]|uniref:2,3-diaminopropionate biosynthesis protein SbnB n=1 Tax=Motiliproteus sp. MSK22-1 TaxID=1897630 RepID=UPI0009754006|nr:2,3-diaminopropionate biosynthesis protein SbnB [Motiliproteus sp. MSK22-1]OMH33816.1 2,3-diaminopropionate biosynthesis protein SbnB [Motiliproteus sp. MSK22-1]
MHNSDSLLYLSQSDIRQLGGDHSDAYVRAIEEGLKLHAEGNYVQPLKPYLRWSGADHIADRIIAMPCYLGGENAIAGLKWIGSRQHNPAKYGKERASAVMVLNDAETNYPVALMEASLISGMRTAAITAVAAKYLAKDNFQELTSIGCGPIAKMQLTTLLQQFSSIKTIHLFDLNREAAGRLVEELSKQFDVKFNLCDSAEQAVRAGEMVITCTVANEPYLEFDWLQKGCFLANVSIMDVHKEVFVKADKVVVDDWDQSNREKKIINQLVLEGKFSREQLHAELGELVTGEKSGRENDQEIILLNPMGMAIDDLVCARYFYLAAKAQGVGTMLPLF